MVAISAVRYRLHRSGTIEYYFDHRYCCDERSTLPPSPPPYKAFRGDKQAVGASLQNVRHYMHFLCSYLRTEGMTITGAVKRLCALNLQKMSHNMARWL